MLSNKLKAIIAAKLVLVVLLVGVYTNFLRLGDRPLAGETAAPAEPAGGVPAASAPDQGAPAASPHEEPPEEPKAAAATTLAQHGGDKPAPGGSTLESLLEMPELDSSDISKDEIGRYLNLIESLKQQATTKIELLQGKEKDLQKLEVTLDQKIAAIEKERQYIANTLQKEKKIQEDRLTTLVEFYSKMEPKKAAPVFEKLDKDLVVALFKKMKQKQITKILEVMNPEASVKLTEYYGRIGSGREYQILQELNQSLKQAFAECKS